MSTPIDQWPLPGGASIDLLRMPSQTGVAVRSIERVAGAALRELVLRGVVVPSLQPTTGPESMQLAATVVPPSGPLPFGQRAVAERLCLVEPGPLHTMVRASQADAIVRRAAGLPRERVRVRDFFSFHFGPPKTMEGTALRTAHDEVQSLEGRGLAVRVERRALRVFKVIEQQRTALGDDWARRAGAVLAQLADLDALVRDDPLEAAGVVQGAGALVAVAPVSLLSIARLAQVVPAAQRPVAGGHDHAFDVIGGVEATLRAALPDIDARLRDPDAAIPDILGLVSAAKVAAAPTTL